MDETLEIYVVTDTDECLSYCPHRRQMIGSTVCVEDCNAHAPIKTELAYRFQCKLSGIKYRRIVVRILENN